MKTGRDQPVVSQVRLEKRPETSTRMVPARDKEKKKIQLEEMKREQSNA
jgi:hypothetical protein